jgi:hypothetical protein
VYHQRVTIGPQYLGPPSIGPPANPRSDSPNRTLHRRHRGLRRYPQLPRSVIYRIATALSSVSTIIQTIQRSIKRCGLASQNNKQTIEPPNMSKIYLRDLVKLEDDNYAQWKAQIKNILIKDGEWGMVCGRSKRPVVPDGPATSADAQKALDARDAWDTSAEVQARQFSFPSDRRHCSGLRISTTASRSKCSTNL